MENNLEIVEWVARLRFFNYNKFNRTKHVKIFRKLMNTNLYKLAEFPRKTIYEK